MLGRSRRLPPGASRGPVQRTLGGSRALVRIVPYPVGSGALSNAVDMAGTAKFRRVPAYARTCWLRNAIVRSQASCAAAASYRGVVSLLNPCWVPGYRCR